jgi:hypothetical protein
LMIMKRALKAGLFLLLCMLVILTQFYYELRIPLARQDPNLALAMEVLDERPGWATKWRIKVFLRFGADADRPLQHWGIQEVPLTVALRRGNVAQVRELAERSNDASLLQAAMVACDPEFSLPPDVLRVLKSEASRRGSDQWCLSMGSESEVSPAKGSSSIPGDP